MHHLKKHLFYYCLVLISFTGLSQNPAHYSIGEKEFSNTQIYSIKQHPNGRLYVATNYGLYVYKNGAFSSVPLEGDKDINSLFSLQLDSKDSLLCSTLKGEIYKLRDDSLKVFATMPEKYLNKHATDFALDEQDNIIVKSNGLVRFKNNKWDSFVGVDYKPTLINGYNPKEILFTSGRESSVKQLKDGRVNLLGISSKNKFPSSTYIFPAYFNNHLLGITKNGFLNDYTLNKRYRITNERSSKIQTDDGNIWLLSDRKGLNKLKYLDRKFTLSKTYFDDLFISTISVTEDGVIFLGTFGHGIIVIPSISFFEYKTELGRVEGITSIPNNKITDSLINTIRENRTLDIIYNLTESESIIIGRSRLFYDSNFDFDFNKANRGFLAQEHINNRANGDLASIKDLQKVDEETQLLATSKGLLKVGNGLKHINWSKNSSGNSWWKYSNKQFRCKAVGYVLSTEDIFYTNYGFLHRVDKNGQDHPVLFNEKSIKCSDIFSLDSMVLCATQKNGILFVENGEVVNQLAEKYGLIDNYVKNILVFNDKLYIAGRSSFQVYNLKHKKWESLGKYQNVIKGAVSNMLIANDKLWLVSGNKILALPLTSREHTDSFSFDIDEAIFGNTTYKLTEPITVAYNQNNIIIPLDFKGLLYENQVNIEYRLNNNNWISIPSISNDLKFSALEPNDYTLEIRLNYNKKISNQRIITFTIEPAFWQQWWFYSLSILAIVLLISFIAIWQIKKIRKKNKELLEKEKLKASLLDSELKTLRSQMNPHFIFNALNSIQDLILKEDTDASYDYVVLFANLVRSTLNYSNKDYIPIENELAFLEVYLKLEKLRFGDEFNFEITYSGSDGIELPSLIVQPFIENALIHGLLHKKGNKNITIRFEMTDRLRCVITDNGVGRERSKEIKNRQGKHTSFALEAIKKRLSILSNKEGDNFGFIVTDLYQDKIATGTQIVVTIPFIRLY